MVFPLATSLLGDVRFLKKIDVYAFIKLHIISDSLCMFIGKGKG